MSISAQALPKQSLGRIVSDGEVERALDFLRDSADAVGKARARLIRSGHMVKHIEALLTLASEQRSVEAKKCEAKTDTRWLEAITEEAEAAGEFEKLRALREAASAKIEAWRSESANYRGMKA